MNKYVFVQSFRLIALNKTCAFLIKKMFDEAPVKFKAEWEAINDKFYIKRSEDCIGWEFHLKMNIINSMIGDAVVLDKNNTQTQKLINQFLKNLKGERLKKSKDFELEIKTTEVKL